MELGATRRQKRVVLLGLRRHDSLRLLSRLAHGAAFFDLSKTEAGEDADERSWLFCGSIPPALPYVRVTLPDTLLRGLEILVAPSDGICADTSGIDWNDLFAEWLPVVHLDIARIDSGLSDLLRAPYAQALANVEEWVAASGQGALFNSRLADLVTDVPDRLELFAHRQGYKGRAEWFVYENYDARYTDFMLWARAPEQEEDLVRRWAASGLGFGFPFSKFRLKLAFEGAKRKTFAMKKGNLAF